MKVVCHISQGFPELYEQCRDLPDLKLVAVDTVSQLGQEIADAECFIVNGGMYIAEVVGTLKRCGHDLRWIQFASSGTDSAVLNSVPDGVALTNAGDIWAPTVAEHATALLLGLARQLHLLERTRNTGDGSRQALVPTMFPVRGSTVVIAGLGAIGRETAVRVKALGARVVGVARSRRDAANFDQVVATGQLSEALRVADAVILALPLTEDTRHLIDAGALAQMKPSAVIVNIARGDVIDEGALVEALKTGTIAGAGLDVFSTEPLPADSPLRELENVILSPHVAGFGDTATIDALAGMFRDNIERYMSGLELHNRFTLKDVSR